MRPEPFAMAATFGVYFASNRLPSLAAWEQAARALGVWFRIMRVDLRTHSGMLPIAFEAHRYNAGFEFELVPRALEPRRNVAPGESDAFASFRCSSHEWPAAVWAAVSFARASGGTFEDTHGTRFRTLDEAIAYARSESPPQGKDSPLSADWEALRRLARDGSDLSWPMFIDFRVAVPDEGNARALADVASALGYRTRVYESPESGMPWTCECSTRMLATFEGVVAIQIELAEISAEFGGYPDGWDTVGNGPSAQPDVT
jgi:hypothetical protein